MNAEMNTLKLEQRSSLAAVHAKERELQKIQVRDRRGPFAFLLSRWAESVEQEKGLREGGVEGVLGGSGATM